MMPPPPPDMGHGPNGRNPNGRGPDKWKDPTPQNWSEVMPYLKTVIGGTCHRMLYVFHIVWETAPWILFYMVFYALYSGLMPVVHSLIHANLLNALAAAILAKDVTHDFYLFLILQFSYMIINSIVQNVNNILNRISGERVTNNIKMRIITKAREVDLASFDDPAFYERLENANREAGNRPIQILNNVFSIVSTIISVVIYIVVLAKIVPYAPPLIIAISIPSAVVNFIYRRKNFNYVRRRSIDRRQMSYYSDLMVNKDMVKEIRLFGLSERFISGYQRVFERYFGGLKKLIYAEGTWHVVLTLFSTVCNCFLFIIIGKNVILGTGQIGDFSFYTGALNSIANGVGSLIGTTATIYEGTLFIDNLIAFMNEKCHIVPQLEKADGTALPAPLPVRRHCGHTIVFEHVCFRYPGTDRDVLHDVNLTLNAGDTCVLVGLNGAGKTTLIKLLTRLYDPTEGTIYLDGEDIRAYDVKELYAMFGIIFQDFGKYAFSVTDNIAFGDIDRELSMENVMAAATQADADAFIDRLPNKFDTPLMRFFSDDSVDLSIGQWQKLSIARAFYSDSDFLILDEPTASLDAIAEQEIFRQFDALRKDKTTIFVSHRLSSATVANKIIVLENGQVVEEGDHATLMRARGRYYELFSVQAKRYITSAEEGLLGEQDTIPDGDPMHLGHPDGYPGGYPHDHPRDGIPHGGRPGDFPPGAPHPGKPSEKA